MDIAKTIKLEPGRYVVAVSGGVDSVALLDLLVKLGQMNLIVAHFDHGIREDSKADRLHVAALAENYGLPFVYAEGNLGSEASESRARKARYKFLDTVKERSEADAIITAHHQDDVLETAVLNLLRGTGRKGMSSLRSVDGIIRPLLHIPKQHLINYADANQLRWREDSTNADVKYRRNYIRQVLLPRLRAASPPAYRQLTHLIRRQHDLNHAIDLTLNNFLHFQPGTDKLKRQDVTMLPHNLARELVAAWLRNNGKRQFDNKMIERLTIGIKTAQPHSVLVLDDKRRVFFDREKAHMIKS